MSTKNNTLNLTLILTTHQILDFINKSFIDDLRNENFSYTIKVVKTLPVGVEKLPVAILNHSRKHYTYFNSSKGIIQWAKKLSKLLKPPTIIGALEHLNLGCMYSGKSTELLRYLTINADLELRVLYVNNTLDDRDTEGGDESFTTHSSSGRMSKKIKAIKVKSLKSVDVSDYDVIGVDEFQFYDDDDPAAIIKDWVVNKGKRVSVSSLDGDFKINKFGKVFDLIPLCQPGGLRKMTGAKCVICLKKGKIVSAGYTKKIIDNGKDVVVDVGGKNKYIAVCLKCHYA